MRSIFQDIINSIRDFRFYRRVKDFDLKRPVKFVFALVCVITLVVGIRYGLDMRRGIKTAVQWALENLPVIQIQNGLVSAEVEQPYVIEDDGFVFIIDTTGSVTSLREYEGGLLITETQAIYKESEIRTETYNLSQLDSLRIDDKFLKTVRSSAMWVLFPLSLLFLFIGFAIARFLQIFIFSPVTVIAASMQGLKLTYKQVFNIGAYAIVPSSILGALLVFFGLTMPNFWIIYAGLYIIYIVMAVMNCKEMEKPAAEEKTLPQDEA